jgi:hypothetical protein
LESKPWTNLLHILPDPFWTLAGRPMLTVIFILKSTHFTNIVISTGHFPSWWQNGLLVMLGKKPGLCHPDRLWAIALLKGDFN